VCDATESEEIEKVAVNDALPLSVPVPSVVEPSLNVTVPVGVPTPAPVTLSVAVNVTDWPNTDGVPEELTAVLVLALFTVCPPLKEPLLLIKLLSPL
jgi:hypothetical protein